MIKTLMVTERYFPIWGGAENQLLELARLLADHDHKVEIVTRRWSKHMLPVDTVEGISIRRIGIPGRGSIKSVFFSIALFLYLLKNRLDYDVLHSHGAASLGALLSMSAIFTGKPVVAKIATAGRIPRLQHKLIGRVMLTFLKRANAIVCMSREINSELIAIGAKKESIRQIQNGVDLSRFKPFSQKDRSTWRLDRGLERDSIIVVYAGRLVSRKGVDTLIDAWEKVEASKPNVHLFLLGSGDNQFDSVEPALKKRVQHLGLRNVHFVGQVKNPETYLNAVDIFAFPSRKEGLPNALLEAMGAELAVVASRIGGNEDLISDGSTGMLYPVGDSERMAGCLLDLIEDSDRRASLGKQARLYVLKNNSISQTALQYSALYEELCSQHHVK